MPQSFNSTTHKSLKPSTSGPARRNSYLAPHDNSQVNWPPNQAQGLRHAELPSSTPRRIDDRVFSVPCPGVGVGLPRRLRDARRPRARALGNWLLRTIRCSAPNRCAFHPPCPSPAPRCCRNRPHGCCRSCLCESQTLQRFRHNKLARHLLQRPIDDERRRRPLRQNSLSVVQPMGPRFPLLHSGHVHLLRALSLHPHHRFVLVHVQGRDGAASTHPSHPAHLVLLRLLLLHPLSRLRPAFPCDSSQASFYRVHADLHVPHGQFPFCHRLFPKPAHCQPLAHGLALPWQAATLTDGRSHHRLFGHHTVHHRPPLPLRRRRYRRSHLDFPHLAPRPRLSTPRKSGTPLRTAQDNSLGGPISRHGNVIPAPLCGGTIPAN